MTLRDKLRNQYDGYLDRCELSGVDQEEIESFEEFADSYATYLEDQEEIQ